MTGLSQVNFDVQVYSHVLIINFTVRLIAVKNTFCHCVFWFTLIVGMSVVYFLYINTRPRTDLNLLIFLNYERKSSSHEDVINL